MKKIDLHFVFLATANLIVSRCKLHNDCSISISANGELMATYVESGEQRAPMNDTILQIVSLRPTDRGAVLWSKSFGTNLSPSSYYYSKFSLSHYSRA